MWLLLNVQIMSCKVLCTVFPRAIRLEFRSVYHNLRRSTQTEINEAIQGRVQLLPKALLPNNVSKKSCHTTQAKEELYVDSRQSSGEKLPKRQMIQDSVIDFLFNNPDVQAKLENGTNLMDEEWKTVRNNVLLIPGISEDDVDARIMHAYSGLSKNDAAVAYYKFLQNNNYNINFAVARKYLSILADSRNLTPTEKLEITQMYDTMLKQCPYLDEMTTKSCILSMCLTDRWREVEKLLDSINIKNNVREFAKFASVAFLNGEMDLGWQYLSKLIDSEYHPNIVILSYLEYCKKHVNDKKKVKHEIKKLFQFLEDKMYYPSTKVIEECINICNTLGWSSKESLITSSGMCTNCNLPLTRNQLTDEEFQQLTYSVEKDILIGTDIFQRSNVDELKRFQHFIKTTKPYDIVIDGLNLYYLMNKKIHIVIQHFAKQNMKVLLVCRKHFLRQKMNRQLLGKNIRYFATDDLSHDDGFMIYATLASGKQTPFVSNDLFRKQACQLKETHIKKIFKSWLYTHQCMISLNQINNISNMIRKPSNVIPAAQEANSWWHIPFCSKQLHKKEHIYATDIKWLCVKLQECEESDNDFNKK